jgi:hypothetical protein
MAQLFLAAGLIVVAVVVALVLSRRTRPDAPAQGVRWAVPGQLYRDDFVSPQTPWLVVEFSSATCDTCAGTWDKVEVLASAEVAVQDVPWQEAKSLHDRYGIDAVPTVLVADAEGVVRASFVGQPTATDLWATVAELREPGSVPPGCDHGQPAG